MMASVLSEKQQLRCGSGWALVEDDVDGCRRLVVEYGGTSVEWLAVVNEDASLVADLMPFEGGLPNGEAEVYEAYGLESFPSLMLGPQAPEALAREVRGAFEARQFELALRTRPELHFSEDCRPDWLLAKQQGIFLGFHVKGEQFESEVLEVRLEWRTNDSKPEIRVLPSADARQNFPLSCAAFREPPWQQDFATFVFACREALSEPWRRRRDLANEFKRVAAVLHCDHTDYTKLNFVLQLSSSQDNNTSGAENSSSSSDMQKTKRKSTSIYVMTLTFAADFPNKPPAISARDFKLGTIFSFDRDLYKYSPRWDNHQIAKQLIEHATTNLA